MHLRRWRVVETFVPVRDPAVRSSFVKKLRKSLGTGVRITSSSHGVTVRGVEDMADQMTLGRLAAEVSDWVKSSRRSP